MPQGVTVGPIAFFLYMKQYIYCRRIVTNIKQRAHLISASALQRYNVKRTNSILSWFTKKFIALMVRPNS